MHQVSKRQNIAYQLICIYLKYMEDIILKKCDTITSMSNSLTKCPDSFKTTKMFIRYFSIVLIILISSCSPKFGSTITSKQTPLTDTDFILVLQLNDKFINDGVEVGTIKAGDNGFSTSCSYYEIIDNLKQIARNNGANVLKIIKHRTPDQWSSCERITAKIYKVPNFRIHEKEIEWAEERKLTWEDFKGIAELNSGAKTLCGFGYQSNYISLITKAKIFITAKFYCNLSWVRPDQKNNIALLEHEQVHFDLSELYARYLRKKFEERKVSYFNLYLYAEPTFKDLYAMYKNAQDLYDLETEHGLNVEQQKAWALKISNELKELNEYKK
jgi:hypothetical protein